MSLCPVFIRLIAIIWLQDAGSMAYRIAIDDLGDARTTG
jgi:hypothetical protein